jgi:hypothetical protein
MLRERYELLECGEALGWPALKSKIAKVKAGRTGLSPNDRGYWEDFAKYAPATKLVSIWRIAKILRDNNIPKFHPLSGREMALALPPGVTHPDDMTAGARSSSEAPAPDLLGDVPDLPRVMREEWTKPNTVAVYPPGKRRKYPVRKNRLKA